MLKIIIFQLLFRIWLAAGLNKKDTIKDVGLIGAFVLVF